MPMIWELKIKDSWVKEFCTYDVCEHFESAVSKARQLGFTITRNEKNRASGVIMQEDSPKKYCRIMPKVI